MSRLPAPYGDCVIDGLTKDYIYRGYRYSTEVNIYSLQLLLAFCQGCYRSCFQNLVQRECGCGDPRFPLVDGNRRDNNKHCHVFNLESRTFYNSYNSQSGWIWQFPGKCLETRTNELSKVHGSFRCRCQQPCDQSIYTVFLFGTHFLSKSDSNLGVLFGCQLAEWLVRTIRYERKLWRIDQRMQRTLSVITLAYSNYV